MSRRSRTLRFIALFAAYVVALQALLLPLSVAVGGTLDLTPCAAATSAGSTQTPASHQTGCPCAAGCGMQCCVHALDASAAAADRCIESCTPVALMPLPAIDAVGASVRSRGYRRLRARRPPPDGRGVSNLHHSIRSQAALDHARVASSGAITMVRISSRCCRHSSPSGWRSPAQAADVTVGNLKIPRLGRAATPKGRQRRRRLS